MFIGGPNVLSTYQKDDSDEFVQALKNISFNENHEVIVLDNDGNYKNPPPVGTVCEVSHDLLTAKYLKEGVEVKVIAHFSVYDDGTSQVAAIIAKDECGHNRVHQVTSQCLRPKKTLAQIEKEEKEKFIAELIANHGVDLHSNYCRQIQMKLLANLYDTGYIRDDE